ncbi:MAG: transaldolase [Corynebacterium casei]|uniref:Transaldolase n=2 Tax=Corynebacterium casei TaxID=160386 RepID=G7I1J1_9CORY|nr:MULTISPECIES: transaldolase [Corynebacterium]AHI20065.1 transaldolase [Corynebacterium casei LMG S-19264]MDN5707050.1 transaldolase [Corynebacterium casei]MDN5729352.1 transaldolase [Corynebacterium casei]MDN5740652.1 transaldolase [Corynebacterium casei]MDN5784456.1 transaldolase [Corynebacterium casei]
MTTIDDLAKIGTSTWLDDMSRERLESGNLKELLSTKSIVGVTTNPAIFAAAMSKGTAYDADIEKLKAERAKADEAVYSLAIDDVRDACDVFQEVYEKSGGKDGRVSIEVDPRISDDGEATIAQARELWNRVGRENLMIKIPATDGSMGAISEALADGISVNVTLIFSLERYKQVIEAFKTGIRRAAANDLDVSKIHSVASFFVSRVDVEIDKRLEEIGSEDALALRGKAGVANAQQAYALYVSELENATDLPEGTNLQRPLWASTGVKNPDYSPTLYVSELAGPNTVNTMPEKTIDATLESDTLHGDTLSNSAEESAKVLEDIAAIGVDLDDVFAQLEREGVEKFVDAWNELLESVSPRLV